MSGRTIRLFLVDGVPDGLLTAEIGNWTGLVNKAPRSKLAQLSSCQGTGVYILVGEDPNNPDKQQVYIGEADNVAVRLGQHNNSDTKDFWADTVVITSKDENLTKAHVRYLESRLIGLTKQSERATLANGTNPTKIRLPAPDTSDMDYFLVQLQTLLPVLGIQFITPAPKITDTTTITDSAQQSPVAGDAPPAALAPAASPFFDLSISNVHGRAQEVSSQFIVARGAQATSNEAPALGKTYKRMRATLRDNGALKDAVQTGTWILDADTAFSSPSAAAAVLCGYNINGRTSWKIEDSSETYADWQASLSQSLSSTTASEDMMATETQELASSLDQISQEH